MTPRNSRPLSEIDLDDRTRTAVDASHLRSLPSDVLGTLVSDATRLSIPAGSTTHRAGESSGHFEIMVSGLVRVYVTAPDGRTMTVRYRRQGAIIGAASLFTPSFALPATIQTVTDTELLALRPSVVQRAAEQDTRVAHALLGELSERVLSFIAEIPGSCRAWGTTSCNEWSSRSVEPVSG